MVVFSKGPFFSDFYLIIYLFVAEGSGCRLHKIYGKFLTRITALFPLWPINPILKVNAAMSYNVYYISSWHSNCYTVVQREHSNYFKKRFSPSSIFLLSDTQYKLFTTDYLSSKQSQISVIVDDTYTLFFFINNLYVFSTVLTNAFILY